MKLRKGDKIIVLSGKDKGQTGTILAVMPQAGKVVVEGVNLVKRAYKPSQANPKGGIKEEPRPLWASKVALAHPTNSKKGSRVAYQLAKDGGKVRVYAQAGRKEVKDSK